MIVQYTIKAMVQAIIDIILMLYTSVYIAQAAIRVMPGLLRLFLLQ